ncbi:hypothetical protein ACIOWG_16815 [Streptomyces sp. NPDC087658]|uniref:hypothetical protein n=1 Tax=Streptomyces sp. NPDC087658 TaxID=3365800 RepID=UPI0037FBAE48
MTGSDGAWISDPQGPVHSGSGPQFNNLTFTVGAPSRPAGADPIKVVQQLRHQLNRRFIPPLNYGEATERMAVPGAVVLLDGPRGSGRRTAAIMLLHRLGGWEGRFEELSAEQDEGSLDAAPSDRFFLDLSNTTAENYRAAQRLITWYRAESQPYGARLAVVLPAGLNDLNPELEPLVVRLGRPRGLTVLSQHLRADGIVFGFEQLAGLELGQMLSHSPMSELARLSWMTRQARDSGQYGTDFRSWCAEAVAAVTNRTREAAGQVRTHRTANERALLLTTAMLNGASADAVFQGTDDLLKQLGHTPDETSRLAQQDFGEQLESLKIKRDRENRVGFQGLAYDGAVRTHFWANFPDLREGLRDWIVGSVRLPGLTAGDRMNVVARFAEQCLTVGSPEHLCTLAERWTERGMDSPSLKPMREEAAAALEQGLSHERYGAGFRRQIYDWATASSLSADLVRVLIDICRQVMAATHPDQALVRLHHLALRRGGEEIGEARTALLALAGSDRRLYRRLVDRLHTRLRNQAEPNLELLSELIERSALPLDTPWTELTRAWRTVLADQPAADWAPKVHRWLDVVQEDKYWEPVLDVLLTAASGRANVLNRLYMTTCDWVQADSLTSMSSRTARDGVATRFWQKIDSAQGAVC